MHHRQTRQTERQADGWVDGWTQRQMDILKHHRLDIKYSTPLPHVQLSMLNADLTPHTHKMESFLRTCCKGGSVYGMRHLHQALRTKPVL